MKESNKLRNIASFTEAQIKEAEAVRAEVEAIALRIEGDTAQITRSHGKLFGAKQEESRDKTIWRGIVWLANTTLSTQSDYDLLKSFLNYLIDDSFSGREFLDVTFMRQHGMDENEAFARCAAAAQTFLREVLSWLCEPNKHPSLATKCLDTLSKTSQVSKQYSVNDEFDPAGETGQPFFFFIRIDSMMLVAPMSMFILKRVEMYHDGSLELEDAVPVRRCERIGCGKFLVPARTDRKKFCSDTCLRLAHPPRSGLENRDYMRVYRLEREPLSILRKKLTSPRWQNRLIEIENSSSDLAGRVNRLRRRIHVRK
jgi:hypothetical protein